MNIHASLGQNSRPRFLMCPPRYFAVTYSINPWMDPKAWADGGEALHELAGRQWAGLRRTLTAAGAALSCGSEAIPRELACRVDDVAMRDPNEFRTLSARLQSLVDALADACERKTFPAASSGVSSKG